MAKGFPLVNRNQDWRWRVPLESLPIAAAALTLIGLTAQTEARGLDEQGCVLVCLRASYTISLEEMEWALLSRIGKLEPWDDE